MMQPCHAFAPGRVPSHSHHPVAHSIVATWPQNTRVAGKWRVPRQLWVVVQAAQQSSVQACRREVARLGGCSHALCCFLRGGRRGRARVEATQGVRAQRVCPPGWHQLTCACRQQQVLLCSSSLCSVHLAGWLLAGSQTSRKLRALLAPGAPAGPAATGAAAGQLRQIQLGQQAAQEAQASQGHGWGRRRVGTT